MRPLARETTVGKRVGDAGCQAVYEDRPRLLWLDEVECATVKEEGRRIRMMLETVLSVAALYCLAGIERSIGSKPSTAHARPEAHDDSRVPYNPRRPIT